MTAPSSTIQILEKAARVVNQDEKNASILRTFYVEPASAAKTLLIALRGTVVSSNTSNPTDPNSTWSRVRPHNDPEYPSYYCFEASAVPMSKSAVKGCTTTGFDKNADDNNMLGNGQLTAVKAALDVMDNFDFESNPDNGLLTIDQIKAGGIDRTNDSDGYISTGNCGAFVTAVYFPLIFQPGIVDQLDPAKDMYADIFDYVNPRWESVEVADQTGRSLFLVAPNSFHPTTVDPTSDTNYGGLSDTFSKPEIIWHFSIHRLMVPFLPMTVIGLLNKKINGAQGEESGSYIGNRNFPVGTLRFDGMSDEQIILGPDGVTTWHNFTLNYSVRLLYDNFYKVGDFATSIKPNLQLDWIDWNHHFGTPASRVTGVQFWPAGYYPVAWNGSPLQGLSFLGGTSGNHDLHVFDNDPTFVPAAQAVLTALAVPQANNFTGDIATDLFFFGMQVNE